MGKPIRGFAKKILGGLGRVCPKFNARVLFLARTHKWPNLKNPQSFNEKTTWLKLNNYNDNRLVSECADKYSVREYVKSKGCGEILNELYGVYDDFDEIDFNKLPNQFVIKCTHGCAYNIIVNDKLKFDKSTARKKIKRWMKEKYGYATSELHYTKIKPRIIIEKYLCDKNGKMPVDYKFYCMNGEVKGCMVCTDRKIGTHDAYMDYFDNGWNNLSYFKKELSSGGIIPKPNKLNKMKKYAEILSADFPFVRVDFYCDGKNIIFGELTFTPGCSCNPKYSRIGDAELGKMLDITSNKKVCIIGHFGGKKQFIDGQTIKTKEVHNLLAKSGFLVTVKDTYVLKRNPLKIFSEVKNAMKNNDIIILMVSSFGYKLISPVIVRLNKNTNKKIFDFVIGGKRYGIFDKSPRLKKTANSFTKIYVETKRMKNEYEKRGICNVKVIPNFKDIKSFSKKTGYVKKGEFRACVFSRVIEEKGISDAINAVSLANKKSDGHKYYLDIYGKISDQYKEEFERMLHGNSACISYKGVADSEKSSEIISRYDVLLFPTYWEGEGFPGTIIDALFASVPIIATDWNDNFEILEDKKNGLKVNIKSPKEIADSMVELANNKKLFINISEENHSTASNYRPEEVVKIFLSDSGGSYE